MGYYGGQRSEPCPRCGGRVDTLFISVGQMSFSQRCASCGVSDFSDEEDRKMGDNISSIDFEPRYFTVSTKLESWTL